MQVLDGTEQVVNDVLRVLHLEVDVRLDDLLEVTLRVLHHDIESVKSLRIIRVQKLN